MSKPKLLLHSCCAPCSGGVIGQLIEDFDLTLFFYNPNIYPESEFYKRREEQIKFVNLLKEEYVDYKDKLNIVVCDYLGEEYEDKIKGYEKEMEGGSRCDICFSLRLSKTAEYGLKHGFDYFTTTLSVSPYKNADKLNEIGKVIEENLGGIKYLYSNFKKNNGYLNSINNSKKYGLYRQNYCGCKYSRREENN